jgi:hypothetical protein
MLPTAATDNPTTATNHGAKKIGKKLVRRHAGCHLKKDYTVAQTASENSGPAQIYGIRWSVTH